MQYIKNRKTAPMRPTGLGQSTFTGTAAAASVLLMLGQSGVAMAQSDAANAKTLEAVTVVGENPYSYKAEKLDSPKFTQPLVDTTQTVQVVTEQVLKDQQATTLTEAMRNVAGAGTFFAGENGSTSVGDTIYMRGFDTSNSIYVDGVRDQSTTTRDMFNMEAVEVIKGPSGSDYGRSAPSGSINLVTKSPFLDDSLDFSVGFGSDQYKRSTLDWNKQLGETSAFRLNVMGMDANAVGRDRVENKRWGIAPSLAFGLGTDTRVFVDLVHLEQNNVPDGFVPTIGLPYYRAPSNSPFLEGADEVDTSNFYGTRSDHNDVTTDSATLRLEHDINENMTVRNITRWSRTKQDYLLTWFRATDVQGDPNVSSSWMMGRTATTKNLENTVLSNQTNLTAKFDTGSIKHDLSTGIEFAREEQDDFGMSAPEYPLVNIYSPNHDIYASTSRSGADSHGKTDTVSVYAFDTVELNERWQVNGGVRLDHYRTEYDSATACGGTGRRAVACPAGVAAGTPVTTVDESISDNLVNWKLGALYRVAPNGNVYANYAISQQPPGGRNFQLAAAGDGSPNSVDFDPQKAKTLELGTKWELLDRQLLLGAALFRTEIENEVEDDIDGNPVQNGEKRVQGLELTAMGQITDRWSVSAGYTLQNATVEEGEAQTSSGSSQLAYTPKHAFSMWSTYRHPSGFTLGGGGRYVGSMERGSDCDECTPDHVESYWVFDAMAGYVVSEDLDLQLNVYNIFDKDYVASINKSGYRYLPGAERSAVLTANFHF